MSYESPTIETVGGEKMRHEPMAVLVFPIYVAAVALKWAAAINTLAVVNVGAIINVGAIWNVAVFWDMTYTPRTQPGKP